MKRWVGVFLLASARVVAAQSNPEDVVRAFFKAEEEERWQDAAALLDQSYIAGLQRTMVASFRNRPSVHKVTIDELMRADSTMPRAVAEYQLKQMDRATAEGDWLESEFARITSIDSLAALSPAEAASRWLEAKGPVYKTDRSYKRGRTQIDCPGLSDSTQRAMLVRVSQRTHAAVVGSTRNQDSVSYVVIGIKSDVPQSPDRIASMEPGPRVMTVHKVSGAWKIVPTHDMPDAYGLGGMFTFAIGCSRGVTFNPGI